MDEFEEIIRACQTCERKGKWIGGCNFEPRYDEVPSPSPVKVEGGSAAGIRSLMYYTKYVCDVCTCCGKTTDKKE